MKKHTKVITITASIMIVSGILLTFIGYLSGAKLTLINNGNGFKVYDSDNLITESFPLEAFTKIEGKLNDIDFEIIPSTEYKVEITRQENQKISHEIKDQTLYLNEEASRWTQGAIINLNLDFFNFSQSTIKLYVPKDAFFSAVDLVSEYGDVKIDGITSTNFTIAANDGDMILKDINSDKLTITNSYGDISAEDIKGEKTKFTTNDGDITLKEVHTTNLQVSNQYGDMSGQTIVAEQLNLTLTDGDLTLNAVNTNRAIINVQYGDILLSQFDSQSLDIQNDYGDITLEGTLLGISRIYAEYGDVQLILKNKQSELNYSIQSDYGDITVNNNPFEGSVTQTADSNNQLNITAEDGDVNLQF